MSSEITIDLTGYRDRVGDRIEPGTYTATVEDVEVDQTSKPDPKTGRPSVMVNVWLRIQGGEFDGAVIIERLVQRDTTLFRTVNFMQALGMQTPKKRIKLDLGRIVGRQLSVEVDDGRPYEGRVKSEVRAFNRLAGGSSKTNGAEQPSLDLDDVEEPAEEAASNGLEEFAEETTSNPTPEAASAPGPASEPESKPEPENKPDAAADVEAPAEFDLDSIDL